MGNKCLGRGVQHQGYWWIAFCTCMCESYRKDIDDRCHMVYCTLSWPFVN